MAIPVKAPSHLPGIAYGWAFILSVEWAERRISIDVKPYLISHEFSILACVSQKNFKSTYEVKVRQILFSLRKQSGEL
jgi:hypothetical protein